MFVARALLEWEVAHRAGEVLVCVSELATNAFLHGVPPGRGFRVQVWLNNAGLLRLEVHDSGDGVPRIPDAGADADGESGRGLLLVSELADTWGVSPRNPGKIVWCDFAVRGPEHLTEPGMDSRVRGGGRFLA